MVVYNVNPSGGNTGRAVCGCYTSAKVSAVLNKIDGNHSANSNNNDKDCFSVTGRPASEGQKRGTP